VIVVRRVVVTLLAAGLAMVGLSAPPARADAGTHTFALGQLCTTAANGLVTFDEPSGSVTINVDKLGESESRVVIATNAASGCSWEITSLNWTGARHLDELVVADDAFYRNGVNKLASVSFPSSLDGLVLGSRAFGESAPAGSNQLKQVTFPDGLTSLVIGDAAFAQVADGGGNALAEVVLPRSLTSLSIGTQAFAQSSGPGGNALKTVTLQGSMTSLSIGTGAFSQSSTNYFNALQSVTFPDRLTTLTVGKEAFKQSSGYSNRLASVSFPTGLTDLTIGESAFFQGSATGSNALKEVSFPSRLKTLSIANQAFWQGTGSDGSAALEALDFPAGLTSLDIGDYAFYQTTDSGKTTLASIRFPGGLNQLVIGSSAFAQVRTGSLAGVLDHVVLDQVAARTDRPLLAVGENAFLGSSPTWYWFGPDATNLVDAWGDRINATSFTRPVLLGYRTLGFDAAGGSAPGTWYVYPVTRGVGHFTAPQVLGRAVLGSTWSVALPTATRDGYSLSGWCASGQTLCLPKAAGASYTLTAASQNLTARWRLLAPKTVDSLPDATVGTPYRAVAATGAELSCTLAQGTLPAGLSLSGCAISGTPTVAGPAAFTITAANSAGSPDKALTLTVRNAPPSITAAALPSGTVTVPYAATITVGGSGTITCSVTGGSLPPGLTLTGCALAGTPTKAGSYPFTVAASNDGGSGSKTLTVVVAAAKKFTKVYRPKISGKAKVGKALKAKAKTWKPKPATVSWQWYRNGVAIPGATKATYILTRADKGAKVKVTVVCTKVGYQSSSTSKSTAKVR